MDMLDQYFTPTKLAELNTMVNIQLVPYVKDGGWEVNRHHYHSRQAPAQARQALEVYESRENLVKLAEMIEGLKSIENKVEEIQQFVKDNGMEDMVSFCAWDDPMSTLQQILNADLESDALRWMHSNHDC